MTIPHSTKSPFHAKLARLEKLTAFVAKIDEASLGEEPQMRKEYQKIRKLAVKEMAKINQELKKLATETES